MARAWLWGCVGLLLVFGVLLFGVCLMFVACWLWVVNSVDFFGSLIVLIFVLLFGLGVSALGLLLFGFCVWAMFVVGWVSLICCSIWCVFWILWVLGVLWCCLVVCYCVWLSVVTFGAVLVGFNSVGIAILFVQGGGWRGDCVAFVFGVFCGCCIF